MIRSIAPDELEWFIASSYEFLGHSDPRAFARRAVRVVHDPSAEADCSFILFSDGDVPLAGAYVRAPQEGGDDQNLYLSNLWFKRAAGDLETLIEKLLERFSHEAVHCPLYNFSPEKLLEVAPVFEALGFEQRRAFDLEFSLTDLPPLGTPLVLEAWSEEKDELFQTTFRRAEGYAPSETFWAWLKRWRGSFHPNLWFVASQTPDQDPIGYAFYGLYQDGVDGVYYLTAVGVEAQYRGSSEMLRRLLISSMQELAARSPFGRIQTLITQKDPKLIDILQSLGFEAKGTYPAYVKQPR